jgi:hypothetical protein
MTYRGCAVISYFVVLILLLLSFGLSKPIVPVADPSRFTGYPTWHGKLDSLYFFSIIDIKFIVLSLINLKFIFNRF